MDDLRRRFANLDQVRAPDLWDVIERRAEAAGSVARATAVVTPVPIPSRRSTGRSLVLLLVVAAVFVALVAGAVAIGSRLVVLPAIVEDPSPSATISASPSMPPEPQSGVVAYAQSGRIWVVDATGMNARQLVPRELDPEKPRYLDLPDVQFPLAWSPDGSRLYYRFERVEVAGPDDGIGPAHSGLAMTDAAGSKPVDLLDLPKADRSHDPWCPAAVDDDNCEANLDDLVISPDGARLAYPILEGSQLDISTVVTMDVASGQVTRLDSTRTQNPGTDEPCSTDADQGFNELPSWSPDGTRLVFARQGIGPRVDGFCQSTIFTVNVDGSDLRRLVPPDVPALVPRWSPDGSTIIFHTAELQTSQADIYAVRPDGSGLRALTRDGVSSWPHWTRDGRIVSIRELTPDGHGELWIMDADGSNATPIDDTVPALTAAGCTVCPYPIAPNRYWGDGGLNVRRWQPVPAGQP